MPPPGNSRGQVLLAEEYFAGENDLLIGTLRQLDQPKSLAAFADRWKKDPRPWARKQILVYLSQPLNCPGHQPLIKRLFRQAEENHDDELMAAFLVAFDRQVRRVIHIGSRWDFRARLAIREEKLVTPRDVIPLAENRSAHNPLPGVLRAFNPKTQRHVKLFKYRTRYYLRRRAWRYFRWLGYRDPEAYVGAIVKALVAFDDTDLQRGENILDSWALMHVCFGGHDALEIGATHIQLKEGRSLGELSPAPAFPEAWKKPTAAPLLLALVISAPARLVRIWARQLFQRDHAVFTVPLETILALLEHEEADVQQFGAKLLESAAFLATLPVTSWLKLLQTKNEEALQGVCDAFAKFVSGDRLDLAQSLELACARPVPLARLGEHYLKQRDIASPADRALIVALADAKCSAVAADLTAWALKILGQSGHYSGEQVIRFFDSSMIETRAAAWDWLLQHPLALADATLWSRMSETPHDDLRLRFIDYLQQQAELPGTSANSLATIWRSVLLGVHRGGRQKAKAVQQIARAIITDPAGAESLLPVLAAAVRSVRGPEARAGLVAVITVLEAQPQLAPAIHRTLPELNFTEVIG